MPSALELVREVRDEMTAKLLQQESTGAYGTVNWLGLKRVRDSLDAALAEMERDREFLEAAERLCEHDSIDSLEALLAAYRKRREGMKHAE